MDSYSSKSKTYEAYVLHRVPYRESSFLLDLWVQDLGRIKCVAKSLRKTQGNRALDLFQRISVQLYGRGDLKTIYGWDPIGVQGFLTGPHLASALYLNEVLVYLLALYDPYEQLFDCYHETILALSDQGDALQPLLRNFEFGLFDALGYGVNLNYFLHYSNELKSSSDKSTQHSHLYCLAEDGGWQPYRCDGNVANYRLESKTETLYDATILAAIAQKRWSKPGVLTNAKRLTRQVLARLMGQKPIYARQLLPTNSREPTSIR